MQNDLKYGKISSLCGINGYFAGKKLKNISPAEKDIFMGGGKNPTFSKNILPCLRYVPTKTSSNYSIT